MIDSNKIGDIGCKYLSKLRLINLNSVDIGIL